MFARCALNQLTKITYRNILKYTGLTTTILLQSGTERVHSSNFTKQYGSTINNIPIVCYEDVKQLIKRPEVLLIDVREPKELIETGKIPKSVNIPLGDVATALGPSMDNYAFKAKYGRNKPEKNTEIIFHCRSGKRSQTAAELSRSLGYKNIKNYLGSWLDWAEKRGLSK